MGVLWLRVCGGRLGCVGAGLTMLESSGPEGTRGAASRWLLLFFSLRLCELLRCVLVSVSLQGEGEFFLFLCCLKQCLLHLFDSSFLFSEGPLGLLELPLSLFHLSLGLETSQQGNIKLYFSVSLLLFCFCFLVLFLLSLFCLFFSRLLLRLHCLLKAYPCAVISGHRNCHWDITHTPTKSVRRPPASRLFRPFSALNRCSWRRSRGS
mmetsp:Transcript_46571/g.91959  ORF Transcript_46571/g.91959 Transcript_46571/m.91959 type:complete len:208 (-) Transcript_46571:529-1152(-)